jgi:hypothetical protein
MVFKEIGRIITERVKRIDPATALRAGTLIFEVVSMYRAQNSTSAKAFRIIDKIQPDGHPAASIAYAVGGMIDANKAAFVADTARDARTAMGKIATPPPSDDVLALKLKELAELGLEIVIIKKDDEADEKSVEASSGLHIV